MLSITAGVSPSFLSAADLEPAGRRPAAAEYVKATEATQFLLIIAIIRLRERRGSVYWISRGEPSPRLSASLHPISFTGTDISPRRQAQHG